MCGIVGIIQPDRYDVFEKLFQGLKTLQYRGYDSAGFSVYAKNDLKSYKALGVLDNAYALYEQDPVKGDWGFGHTRWATHGKPDLINAHPHEYEKVSMVHNGIFNDIDNVYDRYFPHISPISETDTEKALRIISYFLNVHNHDFEKLGHSIIPILQGHFAFIVMDIKNPHKFFVSCCGRSSMVLGHKNGATYIASDPNGLQDWVDYIVILESGDWGIVDQYGWRLWNREKRVQRAPREHNKGLCAPSTPEPYDHFMMMEIHQQPAIWKTIWKKQDEYRLDYFQSLNLFGCGSAYNAGFLAKHFFQDWTQQPAHCHIPSQFSATPDVLGSDTTSLFISQSGETLDLLEVLPKVERISEKILALVNAPHSALDLRVEKTFYLYAGLEQSVASTKAWSAQVLVMMIMAFHCAAISQRQCVAYRKIFESLDEVFNASISACEHWPKTWLCDARHLLILGRGGYAYALALEAALKIKEVAYLPTQALPAGEMKHGPLALLEKGISVLCLCPMDESFEKNLSTVQELSARSGDIWVLTDQEGAKRFSLPRERIAILPDYHPISFPFAYGVALQMLAYRLAKAKGCTIDRPRHLAKSVTVE